MSLSLAIQQQIEERTNDCVALINRYLAKPLISRPTVAFNQRGKIAGAALLNQIHIRYNPKLLVDNCQVFIDEVVPHEVCHIAVYQLYGRVKPHGQQWQQLMIDVFNLEPKVTHALDVEKVAGKQFTYQCDCSEHQLSIRRHNKVQRHQAQYICRKCNTPLSQR